MTVRQRFLRLIYPLLRFGGNLFSRRNGLFSSDKPALTPFYSLKACLSNGVEFDFEKLRNKKVMIVNTASDCAYTPQYEDLERLYESRQETLEMLAFPSNDFREQESGDDKTIEEFCRRHYGINFKLMQKTRVVLHSGQHAVYDWLTDKNKNGWNSRAPGWNFCKYLIDEKGNLTDFFSSNEQPLGRTILKAVDRKK